MCCYSVQQEACWCEISEAGTKGNYVGVALEEAAEVVEALIKNCGLTKYGDRKVETYSGGNKRKLSIAISLLGNPTVLFLDEPTTAMDPHAAQAIWAVSERKASNL